MFNSKLLKIYQNGEHNIGSSANPALAYILLFFIMDFKEMAAILNYNLQTRIMPHIPILSSFFFLFFYNFTYSFSVLPAALGE